MMKRIVSAFPSSLLQSIVVLALASAAGCSWSPAAHSAPLAAPAEVDHSAQEEPVMAENGEPAASIVSEPEPEFRPEPNAGLVGDDPVNDPFPRKIPVPSEALEGGVEWLNTAGPITVDSLRGKIVVLDFWTYCCINCMHVLPDLKRLEEKYARQLVVIGVHSAKFDTERDSQNIREAILRYEIKHPVVNDAEMVIWQHFGVHAWPTLWLIDPEGNAVGALSGESVYDALDFHIGRLVNYHRSRGTLNEAPVHFDLEAARTADSPLRFPGKIVSDERGRLFISDSNHNRIVITTLEGDLVDIVGSGEIGRNDGSFEEARFFRPQGLALDGDSLYVADTENHTIRRVDLKGRNVETVAGTGEQGASRSHRPQPARTTALNSPWDLYWHEGNLYIAMAGPHQIWVWDRETDEVRAYAGSGREDIEDGELPAASFAQPSGLASDGMWLYVADSEGSSIRAVPLIPDKEVWTVVGTADLAHGRLFEFGDEEGGNGQARLQHPLGVAWHDGILYVADTYNNKIKAILPDEQTAITLVGEAIPGRSDDPPRFDEPTGLCAAGDKLYVADTNNHAIRVVDFKTKRVSTLSIPRLNPPRAKEAPSVPSFPNARLTEIDEQQLKSGSDIDIVIRIQLAENFKLNGQAPITYLVETVNSDDLVKGDLVGKPGLVRSPETELTLRLQTAVREGSGQLRVSLSFLQCREGASGLCEIRNTVWDIPVRVTASATGTQIPLTVEPR